MVDRVRPLKYESPGTGGTQTDDIATSNNPNQDYPDVRGIAIQNDSSNDETVIVSRDASSNMTFQDGVVAGVKTLTELLAGGGGLTEESHRILDTLIHELSEDNYEEYTRVANKVTNVTVWETSSKLKKIREEQYTYSGNQVTQEVDIQYDSAGVEKERLTITYAYTGSLVTSATTVRTAA